MIPLGNNSVQPAPPLGAPFVKASLEAVRAWKYMPPAQPPISFYVRLSFSPDRPSSVVWHDARPPVTVSMGAATRAAAGGVAGGLPAGVVGSAPGPVAPAPAPVAPVAPIRIGGNIPAPTKIKDVRPLYPPEAMAARVEGVVILEATIGVDGRVTNARVLRSIPLLDQSALDAVRQWEFTPTRLNGAPVPIIMSVTVNFTLAGSGAGDAARPTR
jgi:protein TonB